MRYKIEVRYYGNVTCAIQTDSEREVVEIYKQSDGGNVVVRVWDNETMLSLRESNRRYGRYGIERRKYDKKHSRV